MTLPLFTLVLLAGVTAFIVDTIARRRVPAQPVAYDLAAEATVVVAASRPETAAAFARYGVRAEHFVDAGNRRRFSEHAEKAMTADEDVRDGAGADLPLDAALADAAQVVLACAEDRATYPGSAQAAETGDPRRPLRRPVPRMSLVRVAVLWGGLWAFASAVLDQADGFATAALLVWISVGAVLALVDLDTLLLDLPVYMVGYGAAWALAVAAGGVGGLLVASCAAVATAALMWGVGAMFSRLRGRDSLGFGDVILVVSTVGVPVAASGTVEGDPFALTFLTAFSWGMMSLAAGGVAAVVVWWVESRRSGKGAATPFAFVPGLVLGAALTWVLL